MHKAKIKAVELRCLDEETIQKLRMWRNQDFIREQSYNKTIISEKEHLLWVKKCKNDRNTHVFVFYANNEPFGVRQYVYCAEKDAVEVGNYLVSEDYQSMGYGALLIYFGEELLYRELKYKREYAEALTTNIKAIHTAKRIEDKGQWETYQKEVGGVLQEVMIFSGDKQEWEKEKQRLRPLIERFADLNYEVIMNEVHDE